MIPSLSVVQTLHPQAQELTGALFAAEAVDVGTREVPGRSASSGWRRTTHSISSSTRGTPPASRCCATREDGPGHDRSSSFAFSIRRTRRETSGTAASRRANFAAPHFTPIGSKGRTNPQHGQRFDPQKVLLDPYAPSVFFPPAFSREACAQAGTDRRTARRWDRARRDKRRRGRCRPRRPAIHLPRRHRVRAARQGVHGTGQ